MPNIITANILVLAKDRNFPVALLLSGTKLTNNWQTKQLMVWKPKTSWIQHKKTERIFFHLCPANWLARLMLCHHNDKSQSYLLLRTPHHLVHQLWIMLDHCCQHWIQILSHVYPQSHSYDLSHIYKKQFTTKVLNNDGNLIYNNL